VVKLLADEHIWPGFVAGLRVRQPALDIVRIQEMGLSGTDDRDLLVWAAAEDRAIITHDRNTFPDFAYERVRAGEPMAGVIVVDDQMEIGQALDEIEIIAACSHDDELRNSVVYVPLP
jgi:predicted nuclease of predicted toxin-antitoxin system